MKHRYFGEYQSLHLTVLTLDGGVISNTCGSGLRGIADGVSSQHSASPDISRVNWEGNEKNRAIVGRRRRRIGEGELGP